MLFNFKRNVSTVDVEVQRDRDYYNVEILNNSNWVSISVPASFNRQEWIDLSNNPYTNLNILNENDVNTIFDAIEEGKI